MSNLWSLWLDYLDRQTWAPSEREFAKKIGMSPTAFGNWEQGISRLPLAGNLAAFAREIRMPYERVLDAALRDARYLPEPTEESDGHDRSAASTSNVSKLADRTPPTPDEIAKLASHPEAARHGQSEGRRRRAEMDQAGEESQDEGGDQ